MTSIYGPLIDGLHVEEAISAFVEKWLPTYIGVDARRHGWTASQIREAMPNHWGEHHGPIDLWPGTGLPAVVTSVGDITDLSYADPPLISAEWEFEVGAVVYAGEEADTRALTHLYGAALLHLFLHRRSVDGFAISVMPADSRPLVRTPYPTEGEQSRTLGVARFRGTIRVQDVAATSQGPVTDPPIDPTAPEPDAPEATQVNVHITAEEIA